MGAPIKARPLPFERLHLLPPARRPWCEGGPLNPRNFLVVGAWFMAREIEISSSKANWLEIFEDSLGLAARWRLPASKTDVTAQGVARVHRCVCGQKPTPSCPVHSAWDQLMDLQRVFPGRFTGKDPDASLPLFPDEVGQHVVKAAAQDTIRAAAQKLGVPLASPDGAERVSGHSLRATGAQGLARRGLDLHSIQLLGRWGSEAVKGYVRDAEIDAASLRAASASSATATTDLDALLELLLLRLEARRATLPDEPKRGAAEAIVAKHSTEPVHKSALSDALLAKADQNDGEFPWVLNSVSECFHTVLLDVRTVGAEEAVTHCGWRFGHAPHRMSEQSLGLPHKRYCGKCLPAARATAKAALASALRDP